MDFARPHRLEEGTATQSNIRIMSNDTKSADENSHDGGAAAAADDAKGRADIDSMLLDAANRAAIDLFLGPPLTRPRPHPPAASNQVVTNNLLSDEKRRLRLADSRLYPERTLPPSSVIAPHSLVVIFESFDSLTFVYATAGSMFSNRNGHFAHDDFIGKPFGCKVRSRSSGGLGFVFLLRPTPELWARSLSHRTQIVHELDASVVVCQLNLRPNCVVCESGTGSGAMSHAILRTIAPRGVLHTYEFNRVRADAARREFEKNGVGHLVKVHWRDVCGMQGEGEGDGDGGNNDDGEDASGDEGKGASGAAASATEGGGGGEKSATEGDGGQAAAAAAADANNDDDDAAADDKGPAERIVHGGFGLGPAAAHAIFLDLPEPWLAVPHAAHTIVPGGRIGSYSPCVEQSQKTVVAFGKFGFHSVKTIEVRLKEHYVDEVDMEPPPRGRLPRDPPSVAPGAAASAAASSAAVAPAPPGTAPSHPTAGGGRMGGGGIGGRPPASAAAKTMAAAAATTTAASASKSPHRRATRRVPSTVSGTTSTAADYSGEDTGAEADTERSEAETEGWSARRDTDALVAAARSAVEHMESQVRRVAFNVGAGGGGGGASSSHHNNNNNNNNGQGGHNGAGGGVGNGGAGSYDGNKKRKLLVARPFATMRGHTAFLTFATAGNRSFPDANESSCDG